MGRLRDRWLDAGYRSAEKLAAHMLRPGEWPAGADRLGERSLGNNLRALDKGQRRGWWRRHAGLVDTLAAALFCEPEDLERELFQHPPNDADEPAAPRVELAPLGLLRPLVLSREDLPPGVPECVRRAARWKRLWWCTRERNLSVLVGKWLAARGIAVFIAGRTWDEVRTRLPHHGRVFVCLEIADDAIAELANAPELDGLQVCVAAPFPPYRSDLLAIPRAFAWTARDHGPASWVEVGGEPVDKWLPSLVEWAVARVPKKKRPAAADMLDILRTTRLLRYRMGPGDVLDFIGLLTATDKRDRPGLELHGWARGCVIAELDRHARAGSSAAALLVDQGDRVVDALLDVLLFEPSAVWTRGWTRATWTAKLPRSVVPEVDAKTARAVVAHSDSLESDDLKKLRRALHPKPREVIDALQDVALLEPCRDEKRLRPRASWAIEVLFAAAFDRALDRGEARTIGALALQPLLANTVVEALLVRIENEHYIAGLLRHEAPALQDAAVLATCEACALALGLARLGDAAVSRELVEAAWQLRDHIVVRAGPIYPVIPLLPHEMSGLASDFVFALALLSLCEGAAPEGLRDAAAVAIAESAGDALVDLAASPIGATYIPGAARLAHRLILAGGDDMLNQFEDCELFAPTYLFDVQARWRNNPADCDGDREFLTLRALTMPPSALLAGLDAISQDHADAADDVLACLWAVWRESDAHKELPPLAWLRDDPASAERLWGAGSIESKEPFLRGLIERHEYPGPVTRALDLETWSAWIKIGVESTRDFANADDHLELWQSMPNDAIERFLLGRSVDREFDATPLSLAWERFPDRMLELVRTVSIHQALSLLPLDMGDETDRLLPLILGRSAEVRPGEWDTRHAVEWLQSVMARREARLQDVLALQRALTKPGPA